jgi:hypothetical protein
MMTYFVLVAYNNAFVMPVFFKFMIFHIFLRPTYHNWYLYSLTLTINCQM